MDIAYAFLADSAYIRPDMKVDVTGLGVQSFTVTNAPVVLPPVVLVCGIQMQAAEYGIQHEIRVDLVDNDGTTVIPSFLESVTYPGTEDERYRDAVFPSVIQWPGVLCQQLGDYAFHIFIDNVQLSRIPVYLKVQ